MSITDSLWRRVIFPLRNKWLPVVLLAIVAVSCRVKSAAVADLAETAPGLVYTNRHVADVPWSIHIVRVDRSRPEFELHSTHARQGALGLDTLSAQVRAMKPELGKAVAAVNGDFYQRGTPYAGDPRGLQIVAGELISAPIGGICFWIDAAGQPHTTNVTSLFKAVWPGGASVPFGLNESRPHNGAVLFTPAAGSSTRTTGGSELVLEQSGDGSWLPLRAGQTLKARVRQTRATGSTMLAPDIIVLSLGPALASKMPLAEAGAVLTLVTDTAPELRGVRTAISGGPVLARAGRNVSPDQKSGGDALSFEFKTMWERHPRSALGWNDRYFFLIEVDGRQSDLSVGMTLAELADCLIRLGCTEAMNLDGGGSATLWHNGGVANSPCEGHEREIANALVLVRKEKNASDGARAASGH